jgi:hypothetical protein
LGAGGTTIAGQAHCIHKEQHANTLVFDDCAAGALLNHQRSRCRSCIGKMTSHRSQAGTLHTRNAQRHAVKHNCQVSRYRTDTGCIWHSVSIKGPPGQADACAGSTAWKQNSMPAHHVQIPVVSVIYHYHISLMVSH